MNRLFCGTSGFAYKEWKGEDNFYPPETKDKDFLAFYGSHFPTVEINNTFYRLPNKANLEKWAADVPDGFQFSVKASRRITHIKRLKGAEDETSYLFEMLGVLGAKCGPVLFQLPPNAKKNADRLRDFLQILPKEVKAAFEFRHPEWFDDEIAGMLSDAGAALCYADGETEGAQFIKTADWGYLRLRQVDYDTRKLNGWVKKIRDKKFKEVFVYFKHEDAGTGPKLAARFVELWNKK